jgi:ATP-dependent Lhr-like helicase
MSESEDTAAIRKSLRSAWTPFFTRFGRLTPVQMAAIPRVLAGRNVVIASPTASGKTEAVVAPLAELFVRQAWTKMAIVYVVPTRALANDTLVRVQGPLEEMGIATALKHGDKPALPKIPNFLITTLESLDSLLCRRPEAFADTRAVILDEIHLVDGTFRGDQLGVLVKRVRQIAAADVSVHLLSATLCNPERTARKYVADFDLLRIEGSRQIDARYLTSAEEVCTLAKQERWWKLLVFCNKRESVEQYGEVFKRLWEPYPVVVHHGSLSRLVREEAEAVMKEQRTAICVATSTLEIGIDIGDIDLVVLAEPPFSLSALMQRVGRGSRRRQTIQVAAIVGSAEERDLLRAMFEAADAGMLPDTERDPDPSVAIQQVFSVLYQHREGRTEASLVEVLADICSPEDAKAILNTLAQKGWIQSRGGRWLGASQLRDEGDKGEIHSNIPDSQQYSVIDLATGRPVGKIVGVFDTVFLLGQKAWKVVSVSRNTVHARRFAGRAEAPLFRPSSTSGKFTYLLPAGIKAGVQQARATMQG